MHQAGSHGVCFRPCNPDNANPTLSGRGGNGNDGVCSAFQHGGKDTPETGA
jgi:hypothetical protein